MTEEGKTPETEPKSQAETTEKPEEVEKKMEKLDLEEKREEKKAEKTADNNGEGEKSDDENGEDEEGPELDDDEQEENPAYIPKKGRYYMHDSRDEGVDDGADSKRSRADGNWSHDRYVERYQQPKSKKQLVAKYGFDIRHGENEEESIEREKDIPEEESEIRLPQRGRGRARGGPRATRGRVERGATRRRPSNEEEIQGSGDEKGEERDDEFEETRERGGTRRQRPQRQIVRNIRGGRGLTNGRGTFRRSEQERPRQYERCEMREERIERREDKTENSQRRNDDYMENHRRGATRGAVRGFANQPPRQFVRTVSSSNRYERGGERSRHNDDRRQEENGRDGPSERRPSGGYSPRGGRGTRGAVRGAPRGDFRGSSAPKRYMGPRQDGPPPPMVPPARNYAPRQEVVYYEQPPPPPSQHQSSPVVYFDPAAQQQNRPLPPREKKIIPEFLDQVTIKSSN